MDYIYGEFTDSQVKINAQLMHSEVHRLLLYKDKNVSEIIFPNDDEFLNYFRNLLLRYGGLNTLLGEPDCMISMMSTLQAAYNELLKDDYSWKKYRGLILDVHGYIKSVFGEV